MEGIKSILIIEDDEVLRENTKELLEQSEFRIITAANGRIGIEKALKFLPDLILCDILMPQMNGYEVLEHLCNHNPTRNIPFIFISAKTNHDEIRRGMNLGADDYITKPFSEIDLLNAINKRLEKFDVFQESFSNISVYSDKSKNISSLDDFKNLLKLRGENYSFKKRSTIYKENENANFVYLIEQGVVKTLKKDYEGKELITGLYKENNLFGFTSFKTQSIYDETAVAMEDIWGYRFSSNNFREIISNNPDLTIEFAELLSENLSDIKDHLLEMAYSSVLKKTTSTILEYIQKIEEEPKDLINITRNELANVAGISTESFIRSLSQLRKKKIIKLEGRNIRILDLEKLRQLH